MGNCCCAYNKPKTIKATMVSTQGTRLIIYGKTYNGDEFFDVEVIGNGVCSNPLYFLRYKYDDIYRNGDHSSRKVYDGNRFLDAVDIKVNVEKDNIKYTITGTTTNDGKSFSDVVVKKGNETIEHCDLDTLGELKKGYNEYLKKYILPQLRR